MSWRRAKRSNCSTPAESSRSTSVASTDFTSARSPRSMRPMANACSSVHWPRSRSRPLSRSASMAGALPRGAPMCRCVLRVLRVPPAVRDGGEHTGYQAGVTDEPPMAGRVPAAVRACDALPMASSFQHIGYAARIAFVVELAERLHTYGTTAQRLEGALVSVSQTLGLECEPMANPTGMVLTFSDPTRPPGESDTTRVIRVPPGDDDLAKLCEADRIAEDVMAERIGLAEGYAALRALDRPAPRRDQALRALAFGLSAASVAGLLRLPWLDIGTAGAIGV